VTIFERLIEWAHPMCMACLRIRLSPIHGIVRVLGIFPGDRS
jgi:hypothetical protein